LYENYQTNQRESLGRSNHVCLIISNSLSIVSEFGLPVCSC